MNQMNQRDILVYHKFGMISLFRHTHTCTAVLVSHIQTVLKSVHHVVSSEQKIICSFGFCVCIVLQNILLHNCWLACKVCWEYTHRNWICDNRFCLFLQQYVVGSNRCVRECRGSNSACHKIDYELSYHEKKNMKPLKLLRHTVGAPLWTLLLPGCQCSLQHILFSALRYVSVTPCSALSPALPHHLSS